MTKINNIEITATEIESYLQQNLRLKKVCHEILYQKIIAEAANQRKITVSDAEVEAEANQLRRALRLEKAQDTLRWLDDNLLNPDHWENAIKQTLLAKKLAHHLFQTKAEAYFAENHLYFDEFVVYQLVIPYLKLAQELFYQIEEEEISFYQAVHLYDIDEKRRYVCGYEGNVHRWDYPPDIAAAVFKNPIVEGEIIGPIKSDKGYHLFKIENYIPAQLTPKVQQEIIDLIFKQWLKGELNHIIYNQDEQTLDVTAS